MSSSDQTGRKNLVDPSDSSIMIKRQSELLSINRTSIYRNPLKEKTISDEDLIIMHKIDELHTDHPTWGYRTLTETICRDLKVMINQKKVRRMMRDMGVYTIYPKPNLCKRYHAQYKRPYLLRNLNITRPDQVWGIVISYLLMNKGFMYIFIIIDWYSRYIVDYELSNTLEKTFVMNCLKRALSTRKPEIINSDQGSHFTNPDYIELLESAGVKISMGG